MNCLFLLRALLWIEEEEITRGGIGERDGAREERRAGLVRERAGDAPREADETIDAASASSPRRRDADESAEHLARAMLADERTVARRQSEFVRALESDERGARRRSC